MIVCKKCGHQNEDDDGFCGSCGTFLEWVGEKLVEEQPPPPPAPPPEPPEEKGLVERLKDAILEDKVEPPAAEPASKERKAPPPDDVSAAGAAQVRDDVPPAPAKPSTVAEPDDGPSIAASDDVDARSRALAAKLPPPAPAPIQEVTPRPPREPTPEVRPTPVKPAIPIEPMAAMVADSGPHSVEEDAPHALKPAPPKPRPTPQPPAPAPRPIQPGDLICGQCGAGNDATRRFCRQCGTSLVGAAPAVRLPWWKRIFRRRKRKHLAGERPWRAQAGDAGRSARVARGKIMGLFGSTKRLVAILAILGISITFLGPWRTVITDPIGSAAGAVRRLIAPRLEIVHPVRAQGGTEAKGHAGGQAIDDVRQTYWAENARGPGVGEFLIIFFATPTDIDRIDFLIGALDKPEKFLEEPRPKEVRVTFTDATVLEATFKDVDTFQPFNVKARRVKSVRIDIRSVFPGTKGSSCSIAEVKFYVKR